MTKWNILKATGAVLLCCFGVVLGTNCPGVSALDGEKFSLTVSPTRSSLELSPGRTETGEFVVRNTGTVDFDVKIYAEAFYVDNNNDNVFGKENSYTDLAKWVSFDVESVRLPAGGDQTVRYTVAVPDVARGGGQYAALFAEAVSDSSGGGVAATRRIGSLLYAKFEGNADERGVVVSNNMRGWYLDPVVATDVVVRNDGNIDFTASTRLVVRGLFGDVVAESEPSVERLLPDNERTIKIDWNSPQVVGIYHITQETTLGENEVVEYGRWVLVLPIYVIVLVVIVLVAGILLVVLKIRGNVKRGKKGGRK